MKKIIGVLIAVQIVTIGYLVYSVCDIRWHLQDIGSDINLIHMQQPETERIWVKQGEQFTISNTILGKPEFWVVGWNDEAFTHLISTSATAKPSKNEQGEQVFGSGTIQTFNFKALKKGNTLITLKRRWTMPAKTTIESKEYFIIID